MVGGAISRGGLTLRGRSEIAQRPVLSCRDTWNLTMTGTPGVALPTCSLMVRTPAALACPARPAMPVASGFLMTTLACGAVIRPMVTIEWSRGRFVLARRRQGSGAAIARPLGVGLAVRVGVGLDVGFEA